MNTGTRVSLPVMAVALAAVTLLAAGAGVSYLLVQRDRRADAAAPVPAAPAPEAGSAAAPPSNTPQGPLPDVVVPLTREAAARAGIAVAPVTRLEGAGGTRLPGVVEPNAYRQVVVTPLVAGRITSVTAELGARVRRGQTLARVFSPELAEARTRYVSARAGLEAHERERERTTTLVEIGAASRQELERLHAEHTARTAEVESTRSRLELLGVPASRIDGPNSGAAAATADVPAPIAGVVTERLANVGLNVDTTAKLFTVVDLSAVWVVADLFEKDFAAVRVGSPATITTSAYPDMALHGRVSYIDPQVSPETRTARVRVEAPNPRHELRLGMYATVVISGGRSEGAPAVPKSAVQTVGDRQVVYVVDPATADRFTEREVRLGRAAGDRVEVLSGVRAGDVVVTEGSFFVRAERERLGLRPASPSEAARGQAPDAAEAVQTRKVLVTEQGYEPARVRLRAGVPARLTFVRTTEKTCGTEVVFPSLNISRALPLDQPVTIELAPRGGEIAFSCGMGMLAGTLVAE